MKSLTGLDATFLYLETPEMPMHVGSFNLCALPPGFKGSFHEAVTKHIAKRMHLAPVFSRKLVFMPLDLGHPLWVEADSVDIGFHIRRADPTKKSAAPMTLADAHKLCAKLHCELIDRNFPLWEFYIFDRIKLPESMGGKLVAGFFSKVHHAALDGKGGVMLANALLDLSPIPREVPAPDPRKRRMRESDLKISKMIGSVFSSSLGQLIKAAKSLPSAATAFGSTLAKQSTGSSDELQANMTLKAPMKMAPATPFNAVITKTRVFVTATLPLAECKAMGKVAGGSFNDIVLWICSTALRSYLTQHFSLPKKSLVAAMPVSLRDAAEGSSKDAANLGNQVSMTLVELGTQLADPFKRMNAIMASTAKVKTSMQSIKGLLPTDYPSLLAPWLVGGAAKMALKVYSKLGSRGMAPRLPTLANLVISNVPGAPVPLYLAGAEFLSFHPLSIITHGLGLNITVQTYAGRVDFGIIADKKVLPHATDLAKAIEAAFSQAQGLLILPAVTEAPVRKSVAKVMQKPKVTQKPKLEMPSLVKPALSRDTAGKSASTQKTNAPIHGKSDVKKIARGKAIKP